MIWNKSVASFGDRSPDVTPDWVSCSCVKVPLWNSNTFFFLIRCSCDRNDQYFFFHSTATMTFLQTHQGWNSTFKTQTDVFACERCTNIHLKKWTGECVEKEKTRCFRIEFACKNKCDTWCTCVLLQYNHLRLWFSSCIMHLTQGPRFSDCVNKLKQQIMFKSFSLRPGKTEIHYSWLLLLGIQR